MPLHIVRQDITKMKVDAIVNAANKTLLGGGGVDGCIHRAAGSELLEECRKLGGCETGDAKVTKAYKLPCKYVIHTVGPIYRDGKHNEAALLCSCYRTSLILAKEYGCETVAFPLISSGIYGYPKKEAMEIATEMIKEFLAHNDMTVYLAIFDKEALRVGGMLFSDIEKFIDDNYVDAQKMLYPESRNERVRNAPYVGKSLESECSCFGSGKARKNSLEEIIGGIDESFSEMLLRKIDELGMKDSECYKKANVDRKLFSKIRSNKNYKPSKPTAIAFAIALELSLEETREMLMKAGFALSKSDKFDLIIEFFISNGNYNIYEINEALFAFDQNLLGA